MIPVSIHEYGRTAHRNGVCWSETGMKAFRTSHHRFNPEYDSPHIHGPVRVLVENHRPVTLEGEVLLRRLAAGSTSAAGPRDAQRAQ